MKQNVSIMYGGDRMSIRRIKNKATKTNGISYSNAIDIVYWRIAIAIGYGERMFPVISISYGVLHIDFFRWHLAITYF